MEQGEHLIIKIDSPDESGLVYRITEIVYKNQFNIISLQEHVEENHFFSRIEVALNSMSSQDSSDIIATLSQQLTQSLPKNAHIVITPIVKKKIIIMTSKEYHCLSEIIMRCKYDTFPADILAVIGNHDNEMKELCHFFNIPFHYVPSPKELSRETHEQQILEILQEYETPEQGIDYIILARYMRILTDTFVTPYTNKIINIHHSFLPAFIGANPYKQAKDRGVKIIGATAHYVTAELDEGPIITQQVLPIDHRMSLVQLKTMGRDIEKITLANALQQVFNDRVFVYKNKTIIF